MPHYSDSIKPHGISNAHQLYEMRLHEIFSSALSGPEGHVIPFSPTLGGSSMFNLPEFGKIIMIDYLWRGNMILYSKNDL
jgi:hypothetical protein